MRRRPRSGRIVLTLYFGLLTLWAVAEGGSGWMPVVVAIVGILQTVINQRNEGKRKGEEKRRKEEHARLVKAERDKQAYRQKYAKQHRVLRSALDRAEKAESEFVELMDTLIGNHIIPGGTADDPVAGAE